MHVQLVCSLVFSQCKLIPVFWENTPLIRKEHTAVAGGQILQELYKSGNHVCNSDISWVNAKKEISLARARKNSAMCSWPCSSLPVASFLIHTEYAFCVKLLYWAFESIGSVLLILHFHKDYICCSIEKT